GKDKEKVNGALGGNEARVKESSKEGLGSSNCAGHGGSVSLGFFIGHVKLTSLGSTGVVNLGCKSSGLAQDNSTGDGLDPEIDGQGPKDRKNGGRYIIDRNGRKPSNALWG
ncbi:hypothetical protein Gotri_021173, partial [Gossypium trilobum]|nr:hypothetical protein [Gossypium trilobum]